MHIYNNLKSFFRPLKLHVSPPLLRIFILCIAVFVLSGASCSVSPPPKESLCTKDSDCLSGTSCNTSTGKCESVPRYDCRKLDCNDNEPCTDDSCDPSTGCKNTPNTQSCDDGNMCTIGDTCYKGTCQPGQVKNCDDNNTCTVDSCDPGTGGCINDNTAANGIICSDGNSCTNDERCSNGICSGGTPLTCNDFNPCTDDKCDPKGAGCVFDPGSMEGKACDDGSKCTENDICFSGLCTGSLNPLLCPQSEILLVDDDGNAESNGFERRYINFLTGIGEGFDLWSVNDNGLPRYRNLIPYSTVIWITGSAKNSALSQEEETELVPYLNQGGNLFLISRNLLDGLCGDVNEQTGQIIVGDFIENKLGIAPPYPPFFPTHLAPSNTTAADPWRSFSISLNNRNGELPFYMSGAKPPAFSVFYDSDGSLPPEWGAAFARDEPGKQSYRTFITTFDLGDIDISKSTPANTGKALFDSVNKWLNNAPLISYSNVEENKSNFPTNGKLYFSLRKGLIATPSDTEIQLIDATGNAIQKHINYFKKSKMLRLTPSAELSGNTDYSVTLTGAITDSYGSPYGTDYTFQFRTGAGPDLKAPASPPSPVTGQKANHDGQIILHNPLPGTDTYYAFFRRKTGETSWHEVSDGPVYTETFVDLNIEDEVFYDYASALRDSAENESPLSNLVQALSRDLKPPTVMVTSPDQNFRTPRPDPISIHGTIDDPKAIISVNENKISVGPEIQPGLFRWTTSIASLREGYNYIHIKAVDKYGNSSGISHRIELDTHAEKPESLSLAFRSATPEKPNAYVVSWRSLKRDIIEFEIQRRSTDQGALFQSIERLTGLFNEYADINIDPKKIYCYRIRASDDLGNISDYSNEVCPLTAGGVSMADQGGSFHENETKKDTTDTTPVSPTKVKETSGPVGIRYMGNWFSGYTGRPNVYWVDSHQPVYYNGSAYLENVQFTVLRPSRDPGWGTTGTITLDLPEGVVWNKFNNSDSDAELMNIIYTGWGTYPIPSDPGYGPDPAVWDSSYKTANISTTVTAKSESSVTFSFQTYRNIIRFNQDTGQYVYGQKADLKAISLRLYEKFIIKNIADVKGRSLKGKITINGEEIEWVLCLISDYDPLWRYTFTQPVDDAGGYMNLVSGGYAFNLSPFQGDGSGLNLDGRLYYTSTNAGWDWAASEQTNPDRFTYSPLGPGWRYPYGMRLIRNDRTFWDNNGIASEEPYSAFLIRGNQMILLKYEDRNSDPLIINNNTYTKVYKPHTHRDQPLGVMAYPVVVPEKDGWALMEEKEFRGYTKYKFDNDGYLVEIKPHGGKPPVTIKNSYTGSGESKKLTQQTVTDSSGRKAEYYFTDEKLERIEEASGGIWEFSYTGDFLVSIKEKKSEYGWSFAYEDFLLTERILPHGFGIKITYDADPVSKSFVRGSVTSTRWIHEPENSAKLITYQRNASPGTQIPDRISITTPTGRNKYHFDFDFERYKLMNSDITFSIDDPTEVIYRDETEDGQIRLIGKAYGRSPFSFDHWEDALGQVTDYHYNANTQSIVYWSYDYWGSVRRIKRSGNTIYEEFVGGTMHAPAWTRSLSQPQRTNFTYYDQGRPNERLHKTYPPGQDPNAQPPGRFIELDYNKENHIDTVTDTDGYITHYVYHDDMTDKNNRGNIRLKYDCLNELPRGTGPKKPTHNYKYDGLGYLKEYIDPDGTVTKYDYNTAGQLVRIEGPKHPTWTLTVPVTIFEYDGDLLRKTTHNDKVTTYIYDGRGRITEIHRPSSSNTGSKEVWKNEYDLDSNIIKTTSPEGEVVSIYDNRGRITLSTLPDGKVVEYDYDLLNRIEETRETADGQTRAWNFVYDELDRVSELIEPAVTRHDTGITKTERPKLRHLYIGANLFEETYEFGGKRKATKYYTNTTGSITQIMTEMGGGQWATYKYIRDYNDRVTQAQGIRLMAPDASSPTRGIPFGDLWGEPYIQDETTRNVPTHANYTYNCFNQVEGITDNGGDGRLFFDYDDNGKIVKVKTGDPSMRARVGSDAVQTDTEAFDVGIDPLAAVRQITDVYGNRSVYIPDADGNEIEATNPQGTTMKTTRGEDGAVTGSNVELNDGRNVSTQFDYDESGNPVGVTLPGSGGNKITFEYDSVGRPIKMTDEDGKSVSVIYNGFGELIKKIYSSGKRIEYMRDASGRITTATEFDKDNNVIRTERREYNFMGQLSALEDDKYRIHYQLDNLGRLLARTTYNKRFNLSQTLTYRWGEFGNLATIEDGGSADTAKVRIEYFWDNEDNLINYELVLPNGHKHQVERSHSPIGKMYGAFFKSEGNRIVSVDIERDRKGRITGHSYFGRASHGLPDVTYAYNELDQIIRARLNDRKLTVSYGYDQRGFLTNETWRGPDGSLAYREESDFDLAGNMVKREKYLSETSKLVSIYSYGRRNELVSEERQAIVRIPVTEIAVSSDSVYSPDYEDDLVNDLLSQDSQEPGDGWRSGIDPQEHWIELDFKGLQRAILALELYVPTERGGIDTFQIDIMDPKTSKLRTIIPAKIINKSCSHDDATGTKEHVIRVTFKAPELASAVRVTIPPQGIPKDSVSGQRPPDIMINEAAVYTIVTEKFTRAYDDDGRLVNDGTYTYDYDLHGRLTEIKGPGVQKEYTYNPEGHLGTETDRLTGKTLIYLSYNGPNPHSVYENNGSTTRLIRKHFSGDSADRHLGVLEFSQGGNPEFHWLLPDGLGNSGSVLDNRGNVLEPYPLRNAWGETILGESGTGLNPFGPKGRPVEKVTGLVNLRTRFYDPKTARFISRDPLGLADGPNRYMAFNNNPLSYSDPYGTNKLEQGAQAAAGVIYGIGRGFVAFGDFIGTAVVGGSAELFGADRRGYFGDAMRKRDKLIEGLSELVLDPKQAILAPVQSFDDKLSAGDAFGAGADFGEFAFDVATMFEGGGAVRNAARSGRAAIRAARLARREARLIAEARNLPSITGKYRYLRRNGLTRGRVRELMSGPNHRVCFTGDTNVAVWDGSDIEQMKISDVKLGTIVAGINPEGKTQENAILDTEWYLLKLKIIKQDGSVLNIELLRPADWLIEREAWQGNEIPVDLSEMGAAGWAEVLYVKKISIETENLTGVVTGTFLHESGDAVLDLFVEGLEDPISTTENHLFWSEDHQEFVAAKYLGKGEVLRTILGTASVVSSIRRNISEPVYNLEVYGEHVYSVSDLGILVHNSYDQLTEAQKAIKLRDLSGHAALGGLHDINPLGVSAKEWIEYLSRYFDVSKSVNSPIKVSFKVLEGELVGHVSSGQHRILALLRKYGDHLTVGDIPHQIFKLDDPVFLFERWHRRMPSLGAHFDDFFPRQIPMPLPKFSPPPPKPPPL